MKHLLKFMKIPFQRKFLFLKAFFLSGWYRFCIKKRPFSRLADKTGKSGYETDRSYEPADMEYLRSVKWAVTAASKRTPWESMCLVRALTAKKLLNRKGIPCTLYMGVRNKEKTGKMEAHAWLRTGRYIVTGENGYSNYVVTGIFGDE